MTAQTFRDPSDLSTLDAFLDEDGIREEVTLRAAKSVITLQLQQEAGASPIQLTPKNASGSFSYDGPGDV